jgi:DNA-binding FrmR family transcriptional regulator
MSKIMDSVTSAVNQAAGELIDNKVTTKLSDAANTVVSSSFAIVEDVLKILRDETDKSTTKPKKPTT